MCLFLLTNAHIALDLVDGGAHHFAETIRKIKYKYVLVILIL